MSTEIVIDLAGKVHAGRPPIVDPSGQMPLTGLGIVLVLEWLAGFVGDPVGAGFISRAN